MQAKNNFSSGVIFNINYLVEPNNCVNTHTFERPLINKERARNILYNIITRKQRVCTKFFHNFMHTFFACINEWVVYAKQGFNNV